MFFIFIKFRIPNSSPKHFERSSFFHLKFYPECLCYARNNNYINNKCDIIENSNLSVLQSSFRITFWKDPHNPTPQVLSSLLQKFPIESIKTWFNIRGWIGYFWRRYTGRWRWRWLQLDGLHSWTSSTFVAAVP